MLQLLLEKAEQLKALGCEGFAILWDDIEPELSKEDAKHFKSFSEAHCRVSNQLHQQLGRSVFLFCPVEYCARYYDLFSTPLLKPVQSGEPVCGRV